MCADCDAASTKLWHGFTNGCRGCDARAVARSPEFSASRRSGKISPAYSTMLGITGVTHEQAKAAWEADFLSRKSALAAAL